MPKPSEANLWYYRLFKPYVEGDQLLQNSPEDWARLQVWDGNGLKPVMPDGFSGLPNEEQINMLYTHMQNKKLFFFELGDPIPKLVHEKERYSMASDLVAPTAPQPPQSSNPSKDEQSTYVQAREEYEKKLTQYQLAQEVFQNYGDQFKAAVDGYNAGRNMEQESKEADARYANLTFEGEKILRDRADRIISEVMSPRPNAPAEVFFETDQQGRDAALRFSQYDQYLEPNGYDLPQDSRLTDYDAATINFAMLGVRSRMERAFFNTGKHGLMNARSAAMDGFSYIVTGMFGTPRINQPLGDYLGLAMQMGQEAIEAYNGGNPKLLGERLAETVQSLKTAFTGSGQFNNVTNDLVAASKLTERLVGLFEKNPDIWKATGLPNQELNNMRGYVQVGKLYDNYLDSVIKFNDAKIRGTELSQEEKAEILADTIIRRMVAKELEKENRAEEEKEEYQTRLADAIVKDQEAGERLDAWVAANKDRLSKEEFIKQRELQIDLLDYNIHVSIATAQPMDHPIFAKLAQPGMLERLRQNLMKDPAILEQAGKPLTELDVETGAKLDSLVDQVQPLMELSKAQAVWNEKFQAMLTQANLAADSDRLMIAQTDDKGIKTMVSVASLLEGGLQDPKSNAFDLLYANAKNGNLYLRGTDEAMPTRLNADGGLFSTQQMERPTRWMRFANLITFGWAYAKECEAAAAYDNYVKAMQANGAAAQKVEEAPKQEAAKEQPKEQKKADPAMQKAKAQPAKSKSLLQPEDKTAMEKFFDHLALPKKYMPENSPIKLDGKTAGVLRIMALGSPEVTVKLNQQGDRMANDPDKNYKRIVDGYFVNKMEPHKGDVAFLQSSWKTLNRALSEAASTGDFSKLGKLIADGLTQNNKVLQAQKRLSDTYTAYAALGGVVLDILKDNPQLEQAVKKHLGPDSKQFDMAKAARNISNLRTEVMPIYEKMLEQFGQTVKYERMNPKTGVMETTEKIAVGGNIRDMAKVAQLFNIDVKMFTGEFKLEGSEYAQDDVVEKYTDELNRSDVLRDFLNSDDRVTTLQDPIKMKELYTKAVEDRQKQIAQQSNQKELENNLENQSKEKMEQIPMA